MAGGAIETLARILEPLGCTCIETQASKERRRRLTVLKCGRRYKRHKKTFGFASGTEEVTVRVDDDATSILWWANLDDKKKIELKDVREVKAKDELGVTVLSLSGDLLLELTCDEGGRGFQAA